MIHILPLICVGPIDFELLQKSFLVCSSISLRLIVTLLELGCCGISEVGEIFLQVCLGSLRHGQRTSGLFKFQGHLLNFLDDSCVGGRRIPRTCRYLSRCGLGGRRIPRDTCRWCRYLSKRNSRSLHLGWSRGCHQCRSRWARELGNFLAGYLCERCERLRSPFSWN